MRLRRWQSEFVASALQHYDSLDKHFLCLATPGAGKTLAAAEIAARLYEQNKIDFILCFSPSVTVSQGIHSTFARRLNRRFDGLIGAIGCSYTYQNMLFFNKDFWQILIKSRVLVIFDEIHHSAGISVETANAWGEEIILNIQSQAAYTLALTGTPWRSDNAPITLSRYLEPDNTIKCDYTYGLAEAVRDGVCRSPKIVLVDNGQLSVTDDENETKIFGSIKDLLSESSICYQSIISNNKAISYLLDQGCRKLAEIRQTNPAAGGLIVASSVEHASKILCVLRNEFHQSAIIVTYKEQEPSQIIEQFRHSNTQWIVSVGMVSEGTDIPRLQICCHLSRVKTELYFRQVLGRILRVCNAPNQQAWLYTFAEPMLTEFAHRIGTEIPDSLVIIKDTIDHSTLSPENNIESKSIELNTSVFNIEFDDKGTLTRAITSNDSHTGSKVYDAAPCLSFEVLGDFRQQVIATFDSPF